ncbi:MAG: glutamine synthetase family protein [Burkholderiales bacterium]|nr:glutamine synthetase family protein [Burkholderiales bacterium]
MSFVERHGLWNESQRTAARAMLDEIARRGIEAVRFSFPDLHGILRSKTVAAAHVEAALADGVGFPSSLLAKDTANRTVFPVFTAGAGLDRPELQGAADALMVADPLTWRVLPWTHATGWVLCDVYFADGRPVPFAARELLKRALARLEGEGYVYLAGLEIEFHIFRLLDARLAPQDAGQPGTPPEVGLLSSGYQLLAETRYDLLEPALELLRRGLAGLGLPLRSFECEYGPSQVEVTLGALPGLACADAMTLFRSAAKQVLRRHGYHATFMCRPKLPNVMSSGWHLHQSLARKSDGANAFVPADGEPLSPVGMRFLGGLLAHARGYAALAAPTINGYKRYRPLSLAPDHVVWGRDNRGALLRVLGGPGDSRSRIENRIGEPAANPYLYLASQIYAGLDGLARDLDPGPPEAAPYDSQAPRLPRTLEEAIGELRRDTVLCAALGAEFVDYYCRVKDAEVARFNLEVSDWEQREYFELF